MSCLPARPAREEHRRRDNGVPRGAADWLRLSAAPTFATMALLAACGGDQPDMICSAVHAVSPFSGMVPMYVLMSVFHLAPWLTLLSSAARGRGQP